MPPHDRAGQCTPACTQVIRFMTDHELPPSIGISTGTYTSVEGYRHLNVFVQWNQQQADEGPVSLGVMFAFDATGAMGAGRYVNLEENLPAPQDPRLIAVSGADSWHGSPPDRSCYLARLPVMGPFVQVFVYNGAALKRSVSVWGYLVS